MFAPGSAVHRRRYVGPEAAWPERHCKLGVQQVSATGESTSRVHMPVLYFIQSIRHRVAIIFAAYHQCALFDRRSEYALAMEKTVGRSGVSRSAVLILLFGIAALHRHADGGVHEPERASGRALFRSGTGSQLCIPYGCLLIGRT